MTPLRQSPAYGTKEKRRLRFAMPRLAGAVLALFSAAALDSQELSLEELPGLKDKAMVLRITTRIEENSQEVWNAYNSKVTLPGRPVSIRLVGDNLVVAIQFTPYIREKGKHVLVAQGQIWLNVPEKGMHYKPTMHSIPMDFGEQIYYFPLGQDASGDNPHIELLLTLYRYGEEPAEEPDPLPPDAPGSPPAPGAVPAGETKTPAASAARPAELTRTKDAARPPPPPADPRPPADSREVRKNPAHVPPQGRSDAPAGGTR